MSVTANNRFMQPVNKQIVRGLADAGANFVGNGHVLHPLYRQMVDLGISGNLKLWIHRDLVKTRNDSGTLYVPTAYDISGEENDAAQTTTGYQPKLVSLGMEFDGSDDEMISTYKYSSYNNPLSIACWLKVDTSILVPDEYFVFNIIGNGRRYIGSAWYDTTWDGSWGIGVNKNSGNVYFSLRYTSFYYLSSSCNHSTYYFYVSTWDGSNNAKLYKNGSLNQSEDNWSLGNNSTYNRNLEIAELASPSGTSAYNQRFKGFLNDIRIFDSVLTEDEISSIYNLTKSYYGL